MTPPTLWPWQLPPLLVAVLGAVAVSLSAWQVRDEALNQARQQAEQQLQLAKARLDQTVEQSFNITEALATLIQDDGQMTQARFDRFASNSLAERPQLRSVVVAPNDVARFVAPLKGNEAVMNLDYRSVPAQYAQVERARTLGTPLVVGPVRLVQGGLGIIQRRPVFMRRDDGALRYWGVISTVVDRDALLQRLGWPHANLAIALYELPASGGLGNLVGGDGGLHTDDAVTADTQLPGARWQLRARPAQGWPTALPWQHPRVLLLALGSLLLVALTAVTARQRHQLAARNAQLAAEAGLRAQAQAESDALRDRFQSLARMGSDWFWEQDRDLRLTQLQLGQDAHPATLQSALGCLRWEAPGVQPDADWADHRNTLARHEPFRDFEYRIRDASGFERVICVSGEPVFDANGEFQGYRGVGRDLTAMRQAERALALTRDELARTRDHLQSLLDSATGIAVIATDLGNRITDFSRGAELMLGYRSREVLGTSPHRFHDAAEMATRAAALSQSLGRPIAPEDVFRHGLPSKSAETTAWTYIRSDGRRVPVSLSLSELRNRQGQVVGHLGVAIDLSNQVGTQRELARTAERLQAILDNAESVAIIAMDVEGRVRLFNRGAEQLLGCPASRVLGHSPRRFHLASEIDAEVQRLSALLGRPVPWHEVFERQAAGLDEGQTRLWTYVRFDDGTHRRVSHTFSAVHDAQGQLTGYMCVARDVTEQIEAQDQLASSNARLQAVLDAADEIGIVSTDLQGRVMLFNRGAERLLGYSAAEMVGALPDRLYDTQGLAQRLQAWSDRLGRPVSAGELMGLQAREPGDQRTQLYTLVAKSGTRLQVSVTLSEMRDNAGVLLGHVAIARDVTAAISHEEALRDTRDRLQSVLDSALDVGIMAVSPQGKIELFNRGAERLFGYGQHEVIGRSTLMFHDLPELQARADAMAAELGRPVHKAEVFTLPLEAAGGSTLTHWTFVRKNGERMHCALRFSRIVDRLGQFRGFLAIVMDTSAQVQAQRALEALNAELEDRVAQRTQDLARAQDDLVRSDKLAALGSMVAGVAHELNTPIGTSLTAASTLVDRSAEIQRAMAANSVRRSTLESFLQDTQAVGELLLRSLGNAADLVQHFKQLSADQTSEQRRHFALAQVVDDVLSVTRPQLKHSGMRVEADIEPELWMDSYPGALGRLLTNLLINAQLHAFEGREVGAVTLQARRMAGQDRVQLVVADNGVGMRDEVKRRAFDPFFTTKLGQGGTGLGLNIVHNIATVILGGSLHLDTAPGQGSRFVFELPVQAPLDDAHGGNLTGYRAPG